MPCTAPEVRAIMPTHTEIQRSQREAIDSAERREQRSGLVVMRKPSR